MFVLIICIAIFFYINHSVRIPTPPDMTHFARSIWARSLWIT